jgi:V8-like Glu-specific endopeptidase
MTNTTHSNCSHEATPSARATCRKARQARTAEVAAARAIIGSDWALTAAHDWTDYKGDDDFEATAAVLAYFAPSGDDRKDARRLADGYIITTSAARIRSLILTRHS